MAVYGLVVLCTMCAFVALGYLYDAPLAELYLEVGHAPAFQESAAAYGVDAERISRFRFVHQAAPYAGVLFGLVLSFIAFRRKKLDKRLLLPVVVAAALFSLLNPLDQPGIRAVFFATGQLASESVTTSAVVNYLLWLGLSAWLAFSQRLIPANKV